MLMHCLYSSHVLAIHQHLRKLFMTVNSGYSEPPDIVNFLPGPFEFTIMRVHCTLLMHVANLVYL